MSPNVSAYLMFSPNLLINTWILAGSFSFRKTFDLLSSRVENMGGTKRHSFKKYMGPFCVARYAVLDDDFWRQISTQTS